MDFSKEIYPGGFYSLLRAFERKQTPFDGLDEVVPPTDVDLDALKSQITPAPPPLPDNLSKHHIRRRMAIFQPEFIGQSRLLLLHAVLVAAQRRRDPPAHVIDLYQRLWREQGDFLASQLSTRWKISAATTFADHGVNTVQASLGMGLSILFDSIKMHDSERRLSGQPGRKPFRRNAGTKRFPLPFDMAAYSLKRGDLDRNMLARLWYLAEQDDTIFPLANSMLNQVMTDQRSIFARLQKLKPTKVQDKDGLDPLPDD